MEKEKRDKQIAIIKASQQLLQESMEKMLKSDKVSSDQKEELKKQIETAMEGNINTARSYLHATTDEIERATFKDPDPAEVEKYNKRVEKRGVIDLATVTTSKTEEEEAPKRRRRKSVEKEMVERDEDTNLTADEERTLMEMTRVKSDSELKDKLDKKTEKEVEDRRKSETEVGKIVKNKTEQLETKKIVVREEEPVEHIVESSSDMSKPHVKEEPASPKKKDKSSVVKYDFQLGDLPPWVQYDVIPLPSKGECYPIDHPLRCGRCPVSYLTASDENVLVSPNAYRDGRMMDLILERKVLDKRVDVRDIATGDKDAIILWLRATAYGEDFPIVAINPEDGKKHNITVKLSDFGYLKFDGDGDDDGYFTYEASNGDVIKYKQMTSYDEESVRNKIREEISYSRKIDIAKNIEMIRTQIKNVELSKTELDNANEDLDELMSFLGDDYKTVKETLFPSTITEQMFQRTASVNGNTDSEYIRGYIENMRTIEARKYRECLGKNRVGVDFKFKVTIPESSGGGSFETFLVLDDTIFANV